MLFAKSSKACLDSVNLVTIGLVSLTMFACSNLQTRSSKPRPPSEVRVRDTSVPPEQDTAGAEPQPETPVEETPAPPRRPTVGLILGPGGMRALAHAGFLHELSKSRIPVKAIVGMEWGALVAGLYAAKGEVHNVDWKLYKLKREALPTKGFFSDASSVGIEALDNYLEESFAGSRVDSFRVAYACPSLSLNGGVNVWQTSGAAGPTIKKCMPYPPIYKPYGAWVASNFSLQESVDWLRQQGVGLVILVNVLAQPDILGPKEAKEDPSTLLLWREVRRSLMTFRPDLKGLQMERIDLQLPGVSIVDYDNRARIPKLGEQAARQVEALVKEYSF